MTLTIRREPTLYGPARDNGRDGVNSEAMLHGAPAHGPGPGSAHAAPKPTRILRFVSSVQIIGSLLAVPLGLASGYSIYKANFAPETTCQQLRGSIISMLDKNVDATTRRMLVRRDVEAFQQNCSGFDPDAHAAFKHLLAADRPPAAPMLKVEPKPVVAKVEPKAKPKLETKAEKVEAKAEPEAEPKAESKVEAKVEAKAEPKLEAQPERKAESKLEAKATPQADAKAEPVQPEAALSDTRWVAAVREALVKHPVEPEAPVLQKSWTLQHPATALPVALAPANAPDLPPAQTISPPPVPKLDAADHPVPPAAIPQPTPVPVEAREDERSRLGKLISDIPVVGGMIRRGE